MDSTRSRCPSLPPEIWIFVFEHATEAPGTLVPDIYNHAGAVGPAYNDAYKVRLRKALATKRALVRVCKQWWHLTTPYLYEYVYVGLIRNLASLSRTLCRSTAGACTLASSQPLGEYTKRLDIAIRDYPEHFGSIPNILATIIKHMPHLAIACFVRFCIADSCQWYIDLPIHVLDALQSCTSLRVLDWSSVGTKPTRSQVTDFLHKCPQLRILHCPDISWNGGFDHQLRRLPPTLTALSLNIRTGTTPPPHPVQFDPYASRPGLAALKEVTLRLHMVPDAQHWDNLLQTHASPLDWTQFDTPTSFPSGLDRYMEVLAHSCPRLHRLTLIAPSFACFVRPNLAIPPITHLGLRLTQQEPAGLDYELLFLFLEDIRMKVLPLRVVQLLNERNLECMFNKHARFVARALEPFMENPPFRIEDVDGVLLTDRLRMLGHL